MTKKRNENLTKSEALIEAWKNRKDYKGYDRSAGSKFNTWRSLMYNKKGKKIGFPEEWKDFEIFDKETQEGWEKGKILCRKDTSKPYSKDNVVWLEKGQENIGKLIKLIYNGEEKTLLEWCTIYDLNYNGVRQRYFKGKGYTPEQILFGKKKRLKRVISDINDIPEEKQRTKAIKMLSQYKLKDKKKGLETYINLDWFIDSLKNGCCYYCGDNKRLGLDRIDNNKGHTMDNVVISCYDCNVARNNNFSFEEMKKIGETIRLIKEARK